MTTRLTKLDMASWAGFAMFAMSGVVTPVCLPEISLTLSTNLAEGGGMETARTALILLAIALAGGLAHRLGKKPFLTAGQYLLAAGLLSVSYSQSYSMLIVSLMIMGVGGGFCEALINPLVLDIHPNDSGKYLNLTNAFYPIGVMVSALLVGELLTLGYSWRVVFRMAAACTLVVGVVFNVSRFPPSASTGSPSWKLVAQILASGRFWLFAAAIFLGAGIESAFTFWSRSHVELTLKDVPRAGAIAVALFAGSMAAGRLLAAKLSGTVSLRTIMLLSAVLGAGVSSILPLATDLLTFYALLSLAGIAAACFWPSILAHAAASMDVDSTILFVMLACLGITGFGATAWVIGAIGEWAGLGAGFFVVPGLFVGLIIVLGCEWGTSRRRGHSHRV